MKVLLLTPNPEPLLPIIRASGDQYSVSMERPEQWPEVDFVVSFGYRFIIKEPHLSKYRDRMINIHASALPWNRGAHPNFWSWFDRTPKGATIHLVNNGIDTGSMIAQHLVRMKSDPGGRLTLRNSYDILITLAASLFNLSWPDIRQARWNEIPRMDRGSYHKMADLSPWIGKLPQGWDTPVSLIEQLGDSYRESQRSAV